MKIRCGTEFLQQGQHWCPEIPVKTWDFIYMCTFSIFQYNCLTFLVKCINVLNEKTQTWQYPVKKISIVILFNHQISINLWIYVKTKYQSGHFSYYLSWILANQSTKSMRYFENSIEKGHLKSIIDMYTYGILLGTLVPLHIHAVI